MIRLAGTLAALLTLFAATLGAAGDRLDAILAAGEVKLGFRTDAPPFAALRGDEAHGFSIDLCVMLADQLRQHGGLERIAVRVAPVDTATRFEAVASGEIDLLCGATTATLTRREQVAFSIPTFFTGVGAVTRADAPELLREVLLENSPAALSRAAVREALAGRSVGARANTTASDWMAAGPFEGIDGIERVEIASHEAGLDAVRSGTLDAYFADRAILLGALAAQGGSDALRLGEKVFTNEPYAIALPRNDERLRLLVDRALSRLYRSGRVLEIFEAHFGRPSREVMDFYRFVALPE